MFFWKKNKNKKDSEKPTEEEKMPESPGIGHVKHIIAVASGKGGVGKSTVATNLAANLKNKGYKIGLLDGDIYGPSQPQMMGALNEKAIGREGQIVPIERHGVKFVSMGALVDDSAPVVWRAPMATKILQQFLANVWWGSLDFLLLDLPPGTGDVQITLAQQANLSGAIIVTTPQSVAGLVAEKGLKMFNQVNVPIIGIIENMSGFICDHCNKESHIFSKGAGRDLAQRHNVPFLGHLPLDPSFMKHAEEGTPYLINEQTGPSARQLGSIIEKMEQSIEKLSHSKDWNVPSEIKVENGGLIIHWPDGHTGKHSAHFLRSQCPCASCVDENTGQRLITPQQIPLDIKIQKFQQVGRYAIAPHFSDHHHSGLFKFSLLRELCECDECLSKKGHPSENERSFEV